VNGGLLNDEIRQNGKGGKAEAWSLKRPSLVGRIEEKLQEIWRKVFLSEMAKVIPEKKKEGR